jgi:hypothetical protein
MKIQLIFKTPDVTVQLSEEEIEESKALLEKYLKWGELITLEFDTEENTARVLKV